MKIIVKRKISEDSDDVVPAKFVKALIDTQTENRTLMHEKHARMFILIVFIINIL